MRIKLEYEDGPVFSTVLKMPGTLGGPVKYRAMMVKINGRPFTAWRDISEYEMYYHSEGYMREVDNALAAAMEKMLTKVFLDACAAVPEGTDLLS